MPSSRGSSWPRDRTHISCIAGRFFTTEPPGKPNSVVWKLYMKVHSLELTNVAVSRMNFKIALVCVSKQNFLYGDKRKKCASSRSKLLWGENILNWITQDPLLSQEKAGYLREISLKSLHLELLPQALSWPGGGWKKGGKKKKKKLILCWWVNSDIQWPIKFTNHILAINSTS